MRGTRPSRILWTITILYWAAIFTATHIPAERMIRLPLSDKTQHVASFSVLAMLLSLCLGVAKRPFKNLPVTVLVICLVYGAVDEWLQIPVHRSCDLLDWYADTTGAAIGVVVIDLVRGGLHR